MTFANQKIVPPRGIRTDRFVVRPIEVGDVELDYAAVMESRESLRLWEQSTWPEDDFTVEANLEDLNKMVERHRTGYAFGYTVMDPAETECFGCVYLMAPTSKMFAETEVVGAPAAAWREVDATVYFWVRESRVAEALDRVLLEALRAWLAAEWPFTAPVFVTSAQFAQQVAMIESTDLELRFELKVGEDPSLHRCYG